MFIAKLKESIQFKKLVEAIKDIVSEINLEVNDKGINLQAMDTSHVALVTAFINAEGFEMYRCDKPIVLGVNVGNLWKLLKCGGNEDSLTLKTTSDPSQINICFENPKLKKYCDFSLSLVNIDSEHLGIPQTTYGSVISMPSSEFNRIVKELYQLNETVNIETSKSFVKFSIQGEQIGGNIKIEHCDNYSDDEFTKICVDEPVNLAFALRYLNIFTKATQLTDRVVLHLSSEYPLMTEYSLGNLGNLKYYLAPRVAEEK